jgi:hypothetical protein
MKLKSINKRVETISRTTFLRFLTSENVILSHSLAIHVRKSLNLDDINMFEPAMTAGKNRTVFTTIRNDIVWSR